MARLRVSPALLAILGNASLANAQCLPHPQAVQWAESTGGNGHWYARVNEPLDWIAATARAEQLGGYLATITSEAENAFVAGVANAGWVAPCHCGWLKVNGTWTWITGEPWGFTNWYAGEPNNQGGQENWLIFYSSTGTWNDMYGGYDAEWLVEWSFGSVDCNSNGTCDGDELARDPGLDLNQDGMIDSCQCIADVVVDGAVNGVDLARVINDWGLTQSPADINGDGIVAGADLTIVLASWGFCAP